MAPTLSIAFPPAARGAEPSLSGRSLQGGAVRNRGSRAEENQRHTASPPRRGRWWGIAGPPDGSGHGAVRPGIARPPTPQSGMPNIRAGAGWRGDLDSFGESEREKRLTAWKPDAKEKADIESRIAALKARLEAPAEAPPQVFGAVINS